MTILHDIYCYFAVDYQIAIGMIGVNKIYL